MLSQGGPIDGIGVEDFSATSAHLVVRTQKIRYEREPKPKQREPHSPKASHKRKEFYMYEIPLVE